MTVVHILLSSDAELQAKLRRKLAEYGTRLAGKTPDADPDTTYKFRVLRELLEKGSVDVLALAVTLSEELGWHNRWLFNNAAKVVAAYNADDTSLLVGSSGLR